MDPKDSSSPALLFSEEEMALEKVGSPVFTGASTGERLLSQRPDLYRITVQLLGQGSGIREIMQITGLHNMTIAAVRDREGITIDTLRKAHAAKHSMCVELGSELTMEAFTQGTIHGEPVKLKLGEIALATKMHFDMKQILTGGATARVEKVEQSQVAAGLERMLDDLPVIDAELVEDAPQINLSGENTSAIAALPAPDPAAGPVCEIEPVQFDIHAPSDGQSVVTAAHISVDAHIASDCASYLPRESSSAVSLAPGSNPPASTSTRSKEGGRGSAPRPRAKNRD
jgi:hypothetical protein